MNRMAMWLISLIVLVPGLVQVIPAWADDREEVQQLREEVQRLKERLQQLEQVLAKQQEEEAKRKEAEAKKLEPVQAGYGKIKFDGLVQMWGSTDGKKSDTFRARRTELKFSGQVHPKVKWAVMFDPAKTLTQNKDKDIVQSSRTLQDAFLTLLLGEKTQLDVGQYKLPTSEEGLRSSAQLDTVERSLISVRGKWGDIRDLGVMLRGSFDNGEYQLGVFNGEGQNVTDANDSKDVAARVVFKPSTTPGLELGLSTYQGKRGAEKATNRRVGAEARFLSDPWVLKAEYMTGRDNVSSSTLADREGWFLLAGYSLDAKRQIVARYDVWDPDTDLSGDQEQDWLLGMNWFLAKHNAKFQLNLVRKNFGATGAAAAGYPAGTRHVNQLLTNFQIAF